MPLIYMSFVDPNKPEGTQFLGGIITEAENLAEATIKTHILGINPGGEIMSIQIPIEFENRTEGLLDRLLTKEELDVMERKYMDHGLRYIDGREVFL